MLDRATGGDFFRKEIFLSEKREVPNFGSKLQTSICIDSTMVSCLLLDVYLLRRVASSSTCLVSFNSGYMILGSTYANTYSLLCPFFITQERPLPVVD